MLALTVSCVQYIREGKKKKKIDKFLYFTFFPEHFQERIMKLELKCCGVLMLRRQENTSIRQDIRRTIIIIWTCCGSVPDITSRKTHKRAIIVNFPVKIQNIFERIRGGDGNKMEKSKKRFGAVRISRYRNLIYAASVDNL